MVDLHEMRKNSSFTSRNVFSLPITCFWREFPASEATIYYPEPSERTLREFGFNDDWLRLRDDENGGLSMEDDDRTAANENARMVFDADALKAARSEFAETSDEEDWKANFEPRWSAYIPVHIDGDPQEVANLLDEFAPNIILVSADKGYGFTSKLVEFPLHEMLFAYVCADALPPLFLVQQIVEVRCIPRETEGRPVEALACALFVLRRYMAQVTEEVAYKVNVVDRALRNPSMVRDV